MRRAYLLCRLDENRMVLHGMVASDNSRHEGVGRNSQSFAYVTSVFGRWLEAIDVEAVRNDDGAMLAVAKPLVLLRAYVGVVDDPACSP